MPDKIDLKTKMITRDKELFLMRKGEITPEVISIYKCECN